MSGFSSIGRRLGTRPYTIAAVWLAAAAGCMSQSALDFTGMSFSEQPLVGKVVWNDLITEELGSARRFYGALFGWTLEPATSPSDGDYLVARLGNVYVAGLVSIASRADGALCCRAGFRICR